MNYSNSILPMITIGMTAYNAEMTLESAINSALAQKWDKKEIIVVDDASTDSTPHILVKLSTKHPEIRVITLRQNKGVASARNRIIQEAKGEFLAFFDDDDQSNSLRLKKQYLRIVEYEEKYAGQNEVICHCARLQTYPDGREHYEITAGCNEEGLCPRGENMAKRILYGFPVENGFGSMATCAQMARLKSYQALNGFDEKFRRCEDTEFNVRFALNGGHFVGIAEPLVRQTMTLGSEKTLIEEEIHHRNIIIKHAVFIRNSGISPLFCARWLDAKHEYLKGKKISFLIKMTRLLFKYPRLCLKRLRWSWPNRKYNKQAQEFYRNFS